MGRTEWRRGIKLSLGIGLRRDQTSQSEAMRGIKRRWGIKWKRESLRREVKFRRRIKWRRGCLRREIKFRWGVKFEWENSRWESLWWESLRWERWNTLRRASGSNPAPYSFLFLIQAVVHVASFPAKLVNFHIEIFVQAEDTLSKIFVRRGQVLNETIERYSWVPILNFSNLTFESVPLLMRIDIIFARFKTVVP